MLHTPYQQSTIFTNATFQNKILKSFKICHAKFIECGSLELFFKDNRTRIFMANLMVPTKLFSNPIRNKATAYCNGIF